MYVVTVTFEVAAEHTAAFQNAVLLQASNSLQREAACRQFDVCFDGDNPELCFLYEKYDDKAAFEAHLATEHFADFDATVSSWIVSKDVRTWTEDTRDNSHPS